MIEIEIRRMQPSDVEVVAEVLSHAFLGYPSYVAIYQGKSETERRFQEDDFKNFFLDEPQETNVAKHEGRIIGAIHSITCAGFYRLKTPFVKEEYDHFVGTEIERLTLDERHKWLMMLYGKHDPIKLHSHFGPFGVLPDFQGKGVGTKLFNDYCVRVDQAGLASYLETETERHVRFYRRYGYELIETDYALGTEHYFMWRDAQTS